MTGLNLFADYSNVATANDTSTLLANHISVLTGQVVDVRRDLLLPSKVPIYFYSTLTSYRRCMGNGELHVMPYLYARVQSENDGDVFSLWDERGSKYDFYGEVSQIGEDTIFNLTPTYGMTNTTNGEPSGEANPLNISVKHLGKCDEFSVTYGDGRKAYYQRVGRYTRTYRLQREYLRNGSMLSYTYRPGPDYRLSRIESHSGNTQYKYGEVNFNYHHGVDRKGFIKKMGFEVVNSLGKKFQFVFNNYRLGSFHEGIHSPYQTRQAYYYTKDKEIDIYYLPEGIESFNGRVLMFDYYGKGEGKYVSNRVSGLRAPIGPNGELQTAYQFRYDHLRREGFSDTASAGVTEVRDAYGRLDRYHYSNHFTLDKIFHFKKINGTDALSFEEQFTWIDHNHLKQLRSKNNGELSHVYDYDHRGNVKMLTMYGNFSGHVSDRVQFHENGYPASKIEQLKIINHYDPKANRLIERIYPNGEKETFSYLRDTHLVTSHLQYDSKGKIIKRLFQKYSAEDIVILKIEDDGSGLNQDDQSNIHIRKICQIEPTRIQAGLGLPHIISEYAEDKTGKRLFLGRKIFTYSPEGWVLTEAVYDSKDQHQYTVLKKYDDHGNVIYETDPQGHEIKRKFDLYNNNVREVFVQKRVEFIRTYDRANRMVEEVEQTILGERSRKFSYDLRSRKTQEIDHLGRETFYEYDSFDNLTKVIHPPFTTAQNQKRQKIEQVIFDPYKRPKYIVDPWGNRDEMRYNSLGQAIEERRSDGVVKQTFYNLDQTVEKEVLYDKSHILYNYDAYKHVIQKRHIDQNGNLIDQTLYKYEGELLIEEIDQLGISTHYVYDIAGRMIEKRREGQCTSYVYDSNGRVYQEISRFPDGILLTYMKWYDHLGRIIEEKKTCGDQVREHDQFKYDGFGNIAEKITFTNAGSFREQFEYDARNRLIKKIDPNGEKIRIRYDVIHHSPTSQWERTITISANGNKTIESFNEVGLLSKLEKFDSTGQPVLYEEFDYDEGYRKIKQRSRIICSGKVLDQIETSWKYDRFGNLICLEEGQNGRITRKEYTFDHLIKKITKMNGVELNYSYNSSRQLERLTSSKGDIDYHYAYDPKGRVIKILDRIQNTEHHISYDHMDHVIEEHLPNGLTVRSKFDEVGRRKRLILPDQSYIDYTYRGFELHSILRNGKRHSYETFDVSGIVLKEKPMLGEGSIEYKLDDAGRKNHLVYSCFEDHITHFNREGLISNETYAFPNAKYEMSYKYDALNQLISEKGAYPKQYRFDSHHLLRMKDGIATRIGQNHQLKHLDPLQFDYDLNGNRALQCCLSQQIAYEYDSLDRLVKVSMDGMTTQYKYDAMHRCFEKRVDYHDTSLIQQFIYDGQNEIGLIEHGKIKELRILGLTPFGEIGASVLFEIHGNTYLPIHDLSGNIALLIDENNQPIESYLYSAFGEVSIFDVDGNELKESSLSPWLFQSKRREESTQLTNFGRRFYDPILCSFINPDPKGLDQIPNPYAFMHNNPRSGHDVWGLDPEDVDPRKKEMTKEQKKIEIQREFQEEHGYSPRGFDSRNNSKALHISKGVSHGIIDFGIQTIHGFESMVGGLGAESMSYDGIGRLSMIEMLSDKQTSREAQLEHWLTLKLNIDAENASYKSARLWTDRSLTTASLLAGASGLIRSAPQAPHAIASFMKMSSRILSTRLLHYTARGTSVKIPKNITKLEKQISNWLGNNTQLIKNKAGDSIFLSSDGMKKIRFDFKRPYPHESPHMHFECFVDGEWKEINRVYPIDVPHK
ncbi:MAG: hypothetical protein K9M07_05855 [Simkaniaceae bacterium]|nr:hypothetical protein [Simkaniaceae bacterium]